MERGHFRTKTRGVTSWTGNILASGIAINNSSKSVSKSVEKKLQCWIAVAKSRPQSDWAFYLSWTQTTSSPRLLDLPGSSSEPSRPITLEVDAALALALVECCSWIYTARCTTRVSYVWLDLLYSTERLHRSNRAWWKYEALQKCFELLKICNLYIFRRTKWQEIIEKNCYMQILLFNSRKIRFSEEFSARGVDFLWIISRYRINKYSAVHLISPSIFRMLKSRRRQM